jgi:type II secretory pathway component PulF
MLNYRQTAVFCSQLKSLLVSGMPLTEALTIVRSLSQNKTTLARLDRVIHLISDGYPLSQAAAALLPLMACGTIGAAERAGDLEECLGRLAVHYENKAELQEKLISALIYPAFVLLLCLGSLLILVFFVLPGLKRLFSDLNTSLPPLTSFLLNGSDALARFWYVWAGALMLAGLGPVILIVRQPDEAERLLFRLPLLGAFYRQELIIQALGTLGALFRGGTPILEALTITADSSGSRHCRQIIDQCRDLVADGVKISEAFQSTGFFPPETVQMIRVGEGSGQLAEMLTSSADFQAKQREVKLKRLTALLEPALTLTVGGAVALIVLAMFLPLINMISSLQ